MNSSHATEHLPLLTWILQYLRSAREHGPGTPTKVEVGGFETTDGAGVTGEAMVLADSAELSETDPASQKKKQLAMERRERLMAQISAMQKKFLDSHQLELEEVDVATATLG